MGRSQHLITSNGRRRACRILNGHWSKTLVLGTYVALHVHARQCKIPSPGTWKRVQYTQYCLKPMAQHVLANSAAAWNSTVAMYLSSGEWYDQTLGELGRIISKCASWGTRINQTRRKWNS
jgi:hypothetical protein